MTVYLVNSLQNILYVHRIHTVLASPKCKAGESRADYACSIESNVIRSNAVS